MIALRKEPERRFANIAVFARALERASLSTRRLPPLKSIVSASQPVQSAFQALPVQPNSPAPLPPAPVFQPPLPAPQPLPPSPQQQPKKASSISRRDVVLGLVGLGAATLVAGGTVWFAKARNNTFHAITATSIPDVTPTTSSASQSIIGDLQYSYTGHTDKVFAVAWSPDGKRIASGSWDKTVQVWDAFTGNTISTFRGHSDSINSLAWSRDGTKIVSSSLDGTAKVWMVENAKLLFSYTGHAGSVTQYGVSAVAWSNDGKLIASAGDDKTVQIWTGNSGTLEYTYTGHTSIVRTIAWSPDDKSIASAGFDKKVRVWNSNTGVTTSVYKGHTDHVCSLAWSPVQGRQYIVSASDDGQVHVWDVPMQKMIYLRRNTTRYIPPPDPLGRPMPSRDEDDFYAPGTNVFAVAWSSDGTRIATVNVGGYVLTWDAPKGGNIAPYSGNTLFVNAVAWSPDGRYLASGNDANTVQVWRER